ncbi:MAG: terminase large subunit domain-containing protein [Hyphomicrobiaceae bacterium]
MSLDETLAEITRRIEERKLFNYLPYGHPETLWGPENPNVPEWSNKPWQLNFHSAGSTNQERMVMAANRPGKTVCAAAETSMHMTGEYPDWWEGRRFHKPVLVWTGSPTNETSRDIVQKELLGADGRVGTGFIPRANLVGKPKMRQAGVSDVIDTFRVRHTTGGVSKCILKTYEQGWRKWQGTEPDVVWLDEEPEDYKVFTEALTRLLTSSGIMMVTFTPLLGETDLVRHFKEPEASGIFLETATWEDAPHLDKDERERLKSSYPAHERKARTEGVPMMGEGAVFPVNQEDIVCKPFKLPVHFARIKGVDFGINHPAAGSCLAWDRDQDIFYVYRVYRKEGQTSVYHARQINGNDPWVPIAWPHDGLNREKAGGRVLHQSYRDEGAISMLSLSARYENKTGGSQPVEPIVMEVLERMQTGRFKVFETCHEFFDEQRNYHRKNGQIVAKRDDILKATFYAVMMRRYAMPEYQPKARAPYTRAVVSA